MKASERIQKQAKRNLERNKSETFKVGEKVRVLMSALYSKHRMMIKKNKSKLLSLKYSPEIYKVYKVIKPDDFVKERYLLRDSNDITILTELKLNNPNAVRQAKLFFGSELLRVFFPKSLIRPFRKKIFISTQLCFKCSFLKFLLIFV